VGDLHRSNTPRLARFARANHRRAAEFRTRSSRAARADASGKRQSVPKRSIICSTDFQTLRRLLMYDASDGAVAPEIPPQVGRLRLAAAAVAADFHRDSAAPRQMAGNGVPGASVKPGGVREELVIFKSERLRRPELFDQK
jgi:hypothetical protein